MSMKIPLREKEGSYTYSFKKGREPMHRYRCKILSTSLRTTWKNLLGTTIEGPFVKWKVPHQTVKVPSIIRKAPYFLSFHLYFHIFFFLNSCVGHEKK